MKRDVVRRSSPRLLLGAALIASAQTPAPAPAVKFDSETISGLGARNIGSAAMSGRVAAIDAVREGARLTVYIGAASGGVWKSVNGGTTYKPVFDKQPVQSIGAVTIDPKNPKVVWVGTGESWTRNSVSIGDGVYKSVDGGDNWTNVGLGGTERIVKILVDPTQTDTVYACAPGKLWSDGDERGVYKTTDGGKTWTKVLKGANLSTGCSMISMDPQNPKTLYAGMWDFRRKGWTFRSGGESADAPSGSGLFKSTDGGATWSELDEKSAKGLPPKPWGRVAVTVAPSKPNVVYAFVEAVDPKNGLYRSDDGGATWQAMDRSQIMVWRPFYFANLIVDPKDENKIYKPDLTLIAVDRRRQELLRHRRRRARRLPRRLDRSRQHRPPDHGRRRRRLVLLRRRQHVVEGGQPADLPVLPRERRHGPAVPRLRRPAGQQLLGRRLGVSRAASRTPSGRTCTAATASGCSPIPSDPTYLYAESQGGEIGRVNRKTHENRAHQAPPGLQGGQAPLQLEHADPHEPDAEGHRLHRRAVPLPLARPRADVGAHLAGPHDERPREAEAGAVGRRHDRQLRGRDARHDLRDLGVAEGPERDLGRHRRRQPAGHARRRQDLDERRRQRRRPAEERVGLVGRGRALRSPARPTPPSTSTPSAT